MENACNRVIEAGNADVVRDCDTGFLQRSVHSSCSLIVSCKNCGWTMSVHQQRLCREVSELSIFGMNLAQIRFQARFRHGAAVSRSTARVPRQALVAYEIDR